MWKRVFEVGETKNIVFCFDVDQTYPKMFFAFKMDGVLLVASDLGPHFHKGEDPFWLGEILSTSSKYSENGLQIENLQTGDSRPLTLNEAIEEVLALPDKGVLLKNLDGGYVVPWVVLHAGHGDLYSYRVGALLPYHGQVLSGELPAWALELKD